MWPWKCPKIYPGQRWLRTEANPYYRHSLRTDAIKVQSQMYRSVETAVVLPQDTCPAKTLPLPQSQLAPYSTSTSSQGHLLTELSASLLRAYLGTCLATALPQEQVGTCLSTSPQGQLLPKLTAALPKTPLGTHLSKAPSQAHSPIKLSSALSQGHPPAELTTTLSQSHLGKCLSNILLQAHLPAGLTKAQSPGPACLTNSHVPLCSYKTQSQPLLVGVQGPHPDLPAHRHPRHSALSGSGGQTDPAPASHLCTGLNCSGPVPGASETQSTWVPPVVSVGHTKLDAKFWGDTGATQVQPLTASPTIPRQEELAASQLASLGAGLASELGIQEGLCALLVKALSQSQYLAFPSVRYEWNQVWVQCRQP